MIYIKKLNNELKFEEQKEALILHLTSHSAASLLVIKQEFKGKSLRQ